VSNLRNIDAIKDLAARAIKLREENNMSQADVAREAGMKVTQYRRIEKAEVNTGISHIKAIANVYEMSLPQFFEYDIYTPPPQD
jgi:transcriptional regulator with XRE-family HTH domain